MIQNIWEERRAHTSKKHINDTRTEWWKDLSRIIHSSAFRRLQSKTQVLGLGESDFYRTRLTHSMEVAQIGVGVLQVLRDYCKKYQHPLEESLPRQSLISAICLAHDIGHPPFGHGGEVALNYCMEPYGGFEGNAHSLRILSKLEKKIRDHGLNPTRRLLLGILKYPCSYSALKKDALSCDKNRTNWLFKSKDYKPPKCYFDCDKDVVEFIFRHLGENDKKLFTSIHPNTDNRSKNKHRKTIYKALDTSIMNLADEISYSIHDLEDAISLDLIKREDWEKFFSQEDMKNIIGEIQNNEFDYASWLEIGEKIFRDSYERKEVIGDLVNILVTNVELCENHAFEEHLLRYNAVLPKKFDSLKDALSKFITDYVIKSANVQQLEFKGQKLVVELFNAFSNDPDRFLPTSTKELYNAADNDENLRMRIICDYVAGMTDDYAIRLHEKLFLPRKGSIFDRL